MKNIIVIIFASIIGNLSAQTIKTYSGELNNGKVTFSYYEDLKTGKEIRHGNYKYVYSDSGDYNSKKSVIITGSYKNGYRNGIWNYSINKINCSDGSSNEYYTGTTIMIQTYSDGMPNGLWSYSENYQVRSQKYSSAGWSWGPYANVTPQSITANFCDGALCGSLKVNTTFEKITGQLNSEGWWTGIWNINSNYETMLDNGIVMKYKIRNDDGSISSQSNFDPEMIQLLNIAKTISKDSIEEFCKINHLKCELILGKKHYNLDYFDGSGRNFMYQKTDGDKTIISDEYGNITDKRYYGCFYLIERIQIIKLSEIPEYNNNQNENINYESILENYKSNLSEEDKTILLQKIEERNKAEQLRQKIKVVTDSIYDIHSKIYQEIRNPNFSTTSDVEKDWSTLQQYTKLWTSYLSVKSKYFKSTYKIDKSISLSELTEFYSFQKSVITKMIKKSILQIIESNSKEIANKSQTEYPDINICYNNLLKQFDSSVEFSTITEYKQSIQRLEKFIELQSKYFTCIDKRKIIQNKNSNINSTCPKDQKDVLTTYQTAFNSFGLTPNLMTIDEIENYIKELNRLIELQVAYESTIQKRTIISNNSIQIHTDAKKLKNIVKSYEIVMTQQNFKPSFLNVKDSSIYLKMLDETIAQQTKFIEIISSASSEELNQKLKKVSDIEDILKIITVN